MSDKTSQQVQSQHTDDWMAISRVVGTAIGECEGKPCLLVRGASNTEPMSQRTPPAIDGYPVVVQHIGEVRTLNE